MYDLPNFDAVLSVDGIDHKAATATSPEAVGLRFRTLNVMPSALVLGTELCVRPSAQQRAQLRSMQQQAAANNPEVVAELRRSLNEQRIENVQLRKDVGVSARLIGYASDWRALVGTLRETFGLDRIEKLTEDDEPNSDAVCREVFAMIRDTVATQARLRRAESKIKNLQNRVTELRRTGMTKGDQRRETDKRFHVDNTVPVGFAGIDYGDPIARAFASTGMRFADAPVAAPAQGEAPKPAPEGPKLTTPVAEDYYVQLSYDTITGSHLPTGFFLVNRKTGVRSPTATMDGTAFLEGMTALSHDGLPPSLRNYAFKPLTMEFGARILASASSINKGGEPDPAVHANRRRRRITFLGKIIEQEYIEAQGAWRDVT